MIDRLAFRVDGFPQTKGSWRPAGRKRTGGIRLVPDNPEETAWAESVAWMARSALQHMPPPPRVVHRPDDRRYAVALDFTLVPPKGRAHRRDIDKLARSCLDALTTIVWLDDEQVDRLEVVKGIVGPGRPKPGVAVVVTAL